jgi:RNA polymerase sigma-70 factor (ECF subfamily)
VEHAGDGSRPRSGDALDDGRLVARVQEGDGDAFDTLVRRHMRRAFSIAFRLLENRADAEDLVQEAFLAALEGIDGFEPGRPFGPWLFRIVVNRGLNARKARSLRRTEALPVDVLSRAPPPDRHAERAELHDALAAALARLDGQRGAIVRLHELEGFTSPEIAEMLELAEGTVRWHLHQARAELREVLGAFGRDAAGETNIEERKP